MIQLKRVPGWLTAYHAAIEEIRRTPFSWDAHECATGLAARVVQAITGHDIAAPYRGRYNDAISAHGVVRDAGFATLADLVASILPEYGHPSEAHIGDIAAIADETPFGHALGVVNGDRIIVLTESGLGSVDRAKASRAFRVGDVA